MLFFPRIYRAKLILAFENNLSLVHEITFQFWCLYNVLDKTIQRVKIKKKYPFIHHCTQTTPFRTNNNSQTGLTTHTSSGLTPRLYGRKLQWAQANENDNLLQCTLTLQMLIMDVISEVTPHKCSLLVISNILSSKWK